MNNNVLSRGRRELITCLKLLDTASFKLLDTASFSSHILVHPVSIISAVWKLHQEESHDVRLLSYDLMLC